MDKILVINPGSTSTKLAYFEAGERVCEETIEHEKQEIAGYKNVADQLEYRYQIIEQWLQQRHIDAAQLDAISARGGMLHPIKGGVYAVTENMIRDLLSATYGEHASNLGAPLARKIAGENEKTLCVIVDPVCVDELSEYARLSGFPGMNNISKYHALNQKAVARTIAKEKLHSTYESCSFIVAHMGGGITVGVHDHGRVVHVNNGLDGTGPFSPERAGTLPRFQLIELCYSGKYTEEQLKKKVNHEGGLLAYLGTNNVKQIEASARGGDEKSKRFLEAMCYQISREIVAGGAVLKGRCDGIILTGGLAYSKLVTELIRERVEFLAPVVIVPGSDENLALAEGAARVLQNRNELKFYE